MSMVSHLTVYDDGEMYCHCPACGESCEVEESDFWQTLPDGNKEYEVTCSCGQSFYASKSY